MRPGKDKVFLQEFARSPAVLRIPKAALVPQVTLPSFATGFGALARIPPFKSAFRFRRARLGGAHN